MSTKSSATHINAGAGTDRALDTPEFIRRLAEDQRVKSGSDLPLSCFIEQVKMQLKGHVPADVARKAPDRIAKRAAAGLAPHQTSELFQAWAMPD